MALTSFQPFELCQNLLSRLLSVSHSHGQTHGLGAGIYIHDVSVGWFVHLARRWHELMVDKMWLREDWRGTKTPTLPSIAWGGPGATIPMSCWWAMFSEWEFHRKRKALLKKWKKSKSEKSPQKSLPDVPRNRPDPLLELEHILRVFICLIGLNPKKRVKYVGFFWLSE